MGQGRLRGHGAPLGHTRVPWSHNNSSSSKTSQPDQNSPNRTTNAQVRSYHITDRSAHGHGLLPRAERSDLPGRCRLAGRAMEGRDGGHRSDKLLPAPPPPPPTGGHQVVMCSRRGSPTYQPGRQGDNAGLVFIQAGRHALPPRA